MRQQPQGGGGGGPSSGVAPAAAVSAASSSGVASKKKFGKNLNRLVKPAAPPIVDRSLGSSRNGLLLLSKNKSGGGSTGTPSAASSSMATPLVSGGGLLSKSVPSGSPAAAQTSVTAAPPPPSGAPLATVKAPNSTHALLLSAVQGGAGDSGASPAQPDAWGVAASAAAPAPAAAATPKEDILNLTEIGAPNNSHTREEEPVATPVPSPAWDEYGGREPPAQNGIHHRRAPVPAEGEESQGAIMSRLARERAEQKRREEQMRLEEQRNRAALRLRELEEKREAESAAITPPPPRRGWGQDGATTATAIASAAPRAKELWEPGMGDRRARSNSAGQDREADRRGSAAPYEAPTNQYAAGPVIQLSSYEDRDRGESRGNSSAPRMLFDPKSGSMVAVKSREESSAEAAANAANSSNNNVNNKKNRTRKGRKESSAAARDSPSTDLGVVRLARKPPANRPDGRGTDSLSGDEGRTAPKTGAGAAASNKGAASASSAGKLPARRTLPRTCGVLFRRDEQGHCYCADDCDGDLGYGAHSVPGGRAKNPQAYATFVDQHQLLYHKNGSTALSSSYGVGLPSSLEGYGEAGPYGDVGLKTGFRVDEGEGELVPEPIEYVRADDKLELVTGLDDSPSLKPTAKEWAPSQAALAAARAVAEQTSRSIAAESSEDEDGLDLDGVVEEVVEDDDDDGPLGLGFDPTLDMDFVMQSPSHDDEAKRVESLAISDLALEPPAFSPNESSAGPRHIFAFGTSGTWGVAHPTAALTGSSWKVSEISDVTGLFGTGAFRVDDPTNVSGPTTNATSLLNIPASSSWGSLPTGSLATLTSTIGESTATTTTTPGD